MLRRAFVLLATAIAFATVGWWAVHFHVQTEAVGPGIWSPAAPMAQARYNHTATRLLDGRVLVAGGFVPGDEPILGSTELYNESTDEWTPGMALTQARDDHSAVLLQDGRVLVAGGSDSFGAFDTVEIFDPNSGVWQTGASMNSRRQNFALTLLADGRVLATGGIGNNTLSSAEIYDPSTNSWLVVTPMSVARANHTATLLDDGRVLITGGNAPNVVHDSAAIYNVQMNSWLPAGTMAFRRSEHGAAKLPDGRVLVVGGGGYTATQDPFYNQTSQTYDPITGLWSSPITLAADHYPDEVISLQDGRVMVANGSNVFTPPTEIFDAGSGSWITSGSMAFDRRSFSMTLLSSGRVLATGGNSSAQDGATALSEIFDPLALEPTSTSTGTSTSTPTLTSTPTVTLTASPAASPIAVLPGIAKIPEGNSNNTDLTIPAANLWICETGPCSGPGEGALRVVERATGVIEELGAYEFTVEYDNFVIQSVNPCDLVFGPGGAGSARGPVDELNSSAINPDCAPDPNNPANGSCAMSLVLENLVHFGCVTSGQNAGPTGDFDLASLLLIPHPDLNNDLFPGNNNGVLTVLKDNGCELVDVFGHPVSGSINGGLTPYCRDLAVTVRILEGDLDLDCDVDLTDAQAIASRYGAFFGGLLYSKWFDLEPEFHDLDIDIKDVQKVFGRQESTCQNPIPAQPPLPPPTAFGD